MRTISCGSMPTTSAGPRRRTVTGSPGTLLIASVALRSTAPRMFEPSVSATLIAAAAPWRTHGRKTTLAFGTADIAYDPVVSCIGMTCHSASPVTPRLSRLNVARVSANVAGFAVGGTMPSATEAITNCSVRIDTAAATPRLRKRATPILRIGADADRAEAHLLEEPMRDEDVAILLFLRRQPLFVDDDRLVVERREDPAPSSMTIASLPKIAPASMSSNDGLASFSSSVIAKNCPGAKESRTVSTSCVTPWMLACRLKRRAPAIGAAAERIEIARRVERHDLLLDDQVAERIEHQRRARRDLAQRDAVLAVQCDLRAPRVRRSQRASAAPRTHRQLAAAAASHRR